MVTNSGSITLDETSTNNVAPPELTYNQVLKNIGLNDDAIAHFQQEFADLDTWENAMYLHCENKETFLDDLRTMLNPKEFTNHDVNKLSVAFDWYQHYVDNSNFSWNRLVHAEFVSFKCTAATRTT